MMRYVLTQADFDRFAKQTRAIVKRLSQGPATSFDLAALSLKYTSRISDARAKGAVIECSRREDGVAVYTLKGVDSDGIPPERDAKTSNKQEQQELFSQRDLHGR